MVLLGAALSPSCTSAATGENQSHAKNEPADGNRAGPERFARGYHVIFAGRDGNLMIRAIGGSEIGGVVQCGADALVYLSHADRDRSRLFHLDPRSGRRRLLFESAFAQPRSCSSNGRFVVFDSTRCQSEADCPDDADLPPSSSVYDLETDRRFDLSSSILQHRWERGTGPAAVEVADSRCPEPHAPRLYGGLPFRIDRNCGLRPPVGGEATAQGAIADPNISTPVRIRSEGGPRGQRALLERIEARWPRLTIISCTGEQCLVNGG